MNHLRYTKKELERLVKLCLQILKEQDKHLLDNDVNERSITYKLATYLQEEFQEFNVDCEYNRLEDLVKRLELPKDKNKINWDDTEAKTVFPDIIIHKRGLNNNNLLVIEIKKTSNKDSGDFDRLKLQTFRKHPYNYKFSLFLRIGVCGKENDLEWFS